MAARYFVTGQGSNILSNDDEQHPFDDEQQSYLGTIIGVWLLGGCGGFLLGCLGGDLYLSMAYTPKQMDFFTVLLYIY